MNNFDTISSPFPVRQVRLYHFILKFPRTNVFIAVCHTGWPLFFLPLTLTHL